MTHFHPARPNHAHRITGYGRWFRRVHARSIACPSCGAAEGVACMSATGKVMVHRSRQRMATRKANESQTWDLVAAASRISHRERRALVKMHCGTIAALAADLTVSQNTLGRWLSKVDPPRTDAGARFASWLLAARELDPPSHALVEVPPVQVPKAPALPTAPTRHPTKAVGRVVTGYCHECERPISGERLFCGPCLARRL